MIFISLLEFKIYIIIVSQIYQESFLFRTFIPLFQKSEQLVTII